MTEKICYKTKGRAVNERACYQKYDFIMRSQDAYTTPSERGSDQILAEILSMTCLDNASCTVSSVL